MIRVHALRGVGLLLQGLALPFLLVGWIATPILQASAWCIDRAREWEARLWARGGDPRTDTRERRP